MNKREFLKILMGSGTDKRFKNLFTEHEMTLLNDILKDIDNMSESASFYGVIKEKNIELKTQNDNMGEKLEIYRKSLNIIDKLTNEI